MATVRKLAFNNGFFYHVFNRGIEGRNVFTNRREYNRAMEVIKYYRFSDTPIRFSQLLLLPNNQQNEILTIMQENDKLVDIISYCLMPNHFHFLLKQNLDGGISKFISNFTNAYSKYFNTKHDRIGNLFQGVFKAVFVENDEQLMHISRYIHINPVSSSLIKIEEIDNYKWSSYLGYLGLSEDNFLNKDIILNMFKSVNDYKKFIFDQVNYAKQLEKIKHLALE